MMNTLDLFFAPIFSASEIELRLAVLMLAMVADAALRDAAWLWQRLPHPVVLLGSLIAAAAAYGNQRRYCGRQRRLNGIIAISILVIIAAGIGIMAEKMLTATTFAGLILETVIITILVAARSLNDHVRQVATALSKDDLAAARQAISMIVGRNTSQLSPAAISRGAIETTAENLSDGVIAPTLFYLAFGLPGIIIYKMINTADSMIGYKSKTYFAFGMAAARLDDLVNLIPARLTGMFIALASPPRTYQAFAAMWRDAGRHASPNAGWPEAAMAAVLGLSLAGPRHYGQRMSRDAKINQNGRRKATSGDISRALAVMWRAIMIFMTMLLAALLLLNQG
jgi:adenosylcobinamide-phosphate synthase